MKRGFLVIGLAVVIVVAIMVFSRMGLFHREMPATPEIMLHTPTYRAPQPTPQPMTQAEVSSLLKNWTYPGAAPMAITPPTQMAAGAQKGPWRVYLYRFTTRGPGRRVPRFYAVKTGVTPKAGAGSSGSPLSQDAQNYWHQVTSQIMLPSPEVTESGEFTLSTRDYLIGAVYAIPPTRKDADVEVLLVAFGGIQPARPARASGTNPSTHNRLDSGYT